MTIIFPDGTRYKQEVQGRWTNFTVPNDGKRYAFLRHDYQRAVYNYRPRTAGLNPDSPNIALPETVPFRPFNNIDFIHLSRAMQAFHLALMRKANPSVSDTVLIAQWVALTGQSVAFTDNHAWNTGDLRNPPDPSKNFALYAAHLNEWNRPIAWKCGISCGGNLVNVIEGYDTIRAIDYLKPLPSIDEVWGDWSVIHWAVECNGRPTDKLSTMETVDGKQVYQWRVTPFPQMKNAYGVKTGIPFPIWGADGKTRVDPATILPAGNGSVFDPYIP